MEGVTGGLSAKRSTIRPSLLAAVTTSISLPPARPTLRGAAHVRLPDPQCHRLKGARVRVRQPFLYHVLTLAVSLLKSGARSHDETGGIRMSDAATRLRVQAARCFRLAKGIAGPKLADELEALGRAFEQEAREVAVGAELHPLADTRLMLKTQYQIRAG
jgi:hypothetical protein